MAKSKVPKPPKTATPNVHPDQQAAMRPDVGTQANFRKKKPPTTYRYDSSLSPALDWDSQNGVRELGEWLLALIDEAAALPAPHKFDAPRNFKSADGRVALTISSLTEAVSALKRIGKPFLTWAGKAERLSFDVPTLPLFVHERPGGIVPHVTLKSIANNERADEEILVDRPEVDAKIVRVTGPFAFEATIPTPVDWDGDGEEDSGSEQAQEYGSFVERMIEVLRRSPVLHIGGGKTVTVGNVRPPAKSLSLSAEALSLNGARNLSLSFLALRMAPSARSWFTAR